MYFSVLCPFFQASNLPNNNVNTVSLARTHWPMLSSSFEIGFTSRVRAGIAPNLSGLRRHWPVRPRQTHGIVTFWNSGITLELPGF